jgi:hypothetical protein
MTDEWIERSNEWSNSLIGIGSLSRFSILGIIWVGKKALFEVVLREIIAFEILLCYIIGD